MWRGYNKEWKIKPTLSQFSTRWFRHCLISISLVEEIITSFSSSNSFSLAESIFSENQKQEGILFGNNLQFKTLPLEHLPFKEVISWVYYTKSILYVWSVYSPTILNIEKCMLETKSSPVSSVSTGNLPVCSSGLRLQLLQEKYRISFSLERKCF